MGEIIQIHVGQAGVQIANACWELYCLEHGINADGSLCDCPVDDTFKNFFAFKDLNKVVPRAVLIDSEPTVIDQIRTGPYGKLYSPGSLITGKEDSGSNFARGYFTMGSELIDITMEAIRITAESCSNLKGFMIFRSIGGGTGSGLGNLIAEQIQDVYEKVSKLEFVIFPSPSMSPLVVEPYNALLATHLGMDAIECTFILDNEALYDVCSTKLNINAPKYKNLNRIIGQTASTFTTSQRFAGSSNVSFAEFQTNLVPYPRIHFPVVSYAPFIPGTGSGYINFSTEQMTNDCFEPSSQLVRCNPVEGKYMTCVLLYRGNVSNSDINASLSQLRAAEKIRFVDWSPTGFKVGLNKKPPFSVPGGGLGNSNRALVALSNNTIIQKAWCRLIEKYDRLYSRRAFIHHYIAEGLEEDALREATEDICALISDYKEVDTAGSMENIPVNIKPSGERVMQGFTRAGRLARSEHKDAREENGRDKMAQRSSRSKGFVESERQLRKPEKQKVDKSNANPNNGKRLQVSSEDLSKLTGPKEKLGEEDTKKEILTNAEFSGKRATKSKDLPEPKRLVKKPVTAKDLEQEIDREQGVSVDELALPRLPGLQSLNFFFGDSSFPEAYASADSKKCTCECYCVPKRNSVMNVEPQNNTDFEPISSNYYSPRLTLPTRSNETFPNEEERQVQPTPAKKSQSLQQIYVGDAIEPSKEPQKRSKSHEPVVAEEIVGHPTKKANQHQNFDTEAVRVKERFSRTQKPDSICCAGGVLRLPPLRLEGKEILSEALSAKERFCNSTCQPQTCEKIEITKDPCGDQTLPRCFQVVGSSREEQKPPCCPKPKPAKCFCCQENNDLIYVNSDEALVPMCYGLTRQECHHPHDGFCGCHQVDETFSTSSTALGPPRCYPSYTIFYQEEESASCLSDERICESCAECNNATMCPREPK